MLQILQTVSQTCFWKSPINPVKWIKALWEQLDELVRPAEGMLSPPPTEMGGTWTQHWAAHLRGHTPAGMAQVKAAGDAATGLQDYSEVYSDMATVSSSAGESTSTRTVTNLSLDRQFACFLVTFQLWRVFIVHIPSLNIWILLHKKCSSNICL